MAVKFSFFSFKSTKVTIQRIKLLLCMFYVDKPWVTDMVAPHQSLGGIFMKLIIGSLSH